AWKQLGDMEADQAMQEYISCVNELDPEGSTKKLSVGKRIKNIFDYCRENNIDHISEAIVSQKVEVNTKDEERAARGQMAERLCGESFVSEAIVVVAPAARRAQQQRAVVKFDFNEKRERSSPCGIPLEVVNSAFSTNTWKRRAGERERGGEGEELIGILARL
ncbi:hypothetical protein KUCAC02_035550, partial [Chaenocephalus aceratus]